jgi:hypothetical protein
LTPASVLVPGAPTDPICALAFDAGSEEAVLHAESSCTDDQGATFFVQQGKAATWAGELSLDTAATTSEGCKVTTNAVCDAIVQ